MLLSSTVASLQIIDQGRFLEKAVCYNDSHMDRRGAHIYPGLTLDWPLGECVTVDKTFRPSDLHFLVSKIDLNSAVMKIKLNEYNTLGLE